MTGKIPTELLPKLSQPKLPRALTEQETLRSGSVRVTEFILGRIRAAENFCSDRVKNSVFWSWDTLSRREGGIYFCGMNHKALHKHTHVPDRVSLHPL
jgi:hypothetical protein